MKKTTEILMRLLKVFYVVLLLLGFVFGFYVWVLDSPSSYNAYGYLVQCDNGKTFDPTSKPIAITDYNEPYSFNVHEIRAECQTGNALEPDWNNTFNQVSFNLTHKTYQHVTRTISDQLTATIISIVIYYLILEILRRTILYIFLGRNFITLKEK